MSKTIQHGNDVHHNTSYNRYTSRNGEGDAK